MEALSLVLGSGRIPICVVTDGGLFVFQLQARQGCNLQELSPVSENDLELKTNHLHANSSLPNDRISRALVCTSVSSGGLEEGGIK